MRYDPVKDKLGRLFGRQPWLQLLFFALMNVLLLRAWHVRRALRQILGGKGRPLRVLDAGTGFGQYAWYVARAFAETEVVAVDIKRDYLERAHALFAKRAPNISVHYDDLTALRSSGPFDCILAIDVLEHIEDDRGALEHCARVLAPGGHVVISTPSDLGGSDVHTEGADSFIEEHVREGYNKPALERTLREAGLRIASSRYTYGPYGSLAWRLVMKVPLRLLNTSWALALLLPLYYVLTMPLALILHTMDLHHANTRGTGLLVVAQKPRTKKQ